MSESSKSIRADLQAAGRGKEITGHELMALERFAEDTRHMIVFDVLTWECPVGDKGERVRIFLTDEGYNKAIGVIEGNLSNMFGDVNTKVGTIAAEVGQTPQGWSSSIFNMIQDLSQTVIIPIAGLVITYVSLLRESKAQRMYFAYDTPDDYEPLVEAGKLLRAEGFTRESRKPNCYVLIGYPGDTMEKAEKRLLDTWAAGFSPYAMLYRDEAGSTAPEWRKFQRLWVRPQILFTTLKEKWGM